MDAHFPSPPANLVVLAGNAHDTAAVAACLAHPLDPARLVDAIHVSVGGQLNLRTRTLDDPTVCDRATECVLAALASLRGAGREGRPLYTAISTTGVSRFGRDVPLGMLPMYWWLLRQPHADKERMEARLAASGERVLMVRPSFLKDEVRPERRVRVGVEDVVEGVEVKQVGYFISKDDVARGVHENLLREPDGCKYEGKAVSLSW
ncbi:NAD(P)-binding domain protein [Cordyceps fumosorosea ARSEF 2679]|uniref:NAD(P)-binding domain protein n=1 Tax=Cordyceps fumosorosea (strain ARSEF 2679) TaxID=1081104 RepID=A0A162JFI0_CORFA|nr:NAD(P)-binding domain protein [Cordyceps fumosorosea ARSEF 2679]OAA43578.1 NAD(P)-binding domain protein [Cordyceps fumosorosea ARSEF 2679]